MTDLEPVEGELLTADGAVVDPHALTARPTAHGVELTCACGLWDAWGTSKAMLNRCALEHAAHARGVLGA